MTLQFDRVWHLILLPRTMDGLCAAILLALAVGISIGGVLSGSGGASYGVAATVISMVCVGLLVGRIAAIGLRYWRSTHVDLLFPQLLL